MILLRLLATSHKLLGAGPHKTGAGVEKLLGEAPLAF